MINQTLRYDIYFCRQVADFGLAHAMPDNQDYYTSNHVIGDYTYMAPEALLDHKVSLKMDTYSFGMVAYECVSSQPTPPE